MDGLGDAHLSARKPYRGVGGICEHVLRCPPLTVLFLTLPMYYTAVTFLRLVLEAGVWVRNPLQGLEGWHPWRAWHTCAVTEDPQIVGELAPPPLQHYCNPVADHRDTADGSSRISSIVPGG